MSDARSLLRAHRAANRIEHPHAAYSDAGKLLCKICREIIKSDSLWDTHTRSTGHRQKAASLQAQTAPTETSHKRKHDDVEAMEIDAADTTEDALPKKRNRTASVATRERETSGTPPGAGLPRRTSTAPAQGVEISIPSRPATPQVGEGSQTSTPNMPPVGRSPLIGADSDASSTPNTTGSATQRPISTESLNTPAAAPSAAKNGHVDEDEWAAFEAEVAAADVPAPVDYASATISAPALTAEELAAKSQEEENERKKHLLDAEIEDEKEDATRALEDEFDEMEQLESRVRKLKERREELRKGSIANLRGAAESAVDKTVKAVLGKENVGTRNGGGAESDEEEDEDDDDWDDGFRFRGA